MDTALYSQSDTPTPLTPARARAALLSEVRLLQRLPSMRRWLGTLDDAELYAAWGEARAALERMEARAKALERGEG